MVTRIKRFSVIQMGKVLCVIYGLFSLILLPFAVIGLISKEKSGIPMLFMVVLYPIMGFLGGIIFAAIYNLVSRWVGGIKFTLENEEPKPL